MATIKTNGMLFGTKVYVTIKGNEEVEEINATDLYAEEEIRKMIKNGSGHMANAYFPEPNTMLQAYALLCNLFGYESVEVDGDIGEIPYKPGVIY